MAEFDGWEKLEQIGSGGQSEVFLVRSPERRSERITSLERMKVAMDGARMADIANSVWSFGRPDLPTEVGALKVFSKTRAWSASAEHRLRSEISILRQGRPGLPKLLASNEGEKWMVTEYFSGKTLEDHPERFKGQSLAALTAFRPLVRTIATSLHADDIVHRDIKPANVFIASDGTLIPGDFGIVYVPDHVDRETATGERVGPRDYMPPWADWGTRIKNVDPSIDVYMLGKLLWCMVSGRAKLPREYHRHPDFDLALMFPRDFRMSLINRILDRCLVETSMACLQSAHELLELVDEAVEMTSRGLKVNEDGSLSPPCFMCGRGFYTEQLKAGRIEVDLVQDNGERSSRMFLRPYACNICTHRAFFAPGYPGEALRNLKGLEELLSNSRN